MLGRAFQTFDRPFEALRENQKFGRVFRKFGLVFKKLGNVFVLQHAHAVPISHGKYGCSPVNIAKFSTTVLFTEHLQVTVSEEYHASNQLILQVLIYEIYHSDLFFLKVLW